MCFPMSLRWSSYVALNPKGGSKMQNYHFPSKITLRLKKVCYKVSLCENCQQQSCKVFIGLTVCAKTIGGDVPFYLKVLVQLAALELNGWFSIIFAHSTSAVTSSEKVQLTLKSTTHFPISSRWTSYVVSKPPKRVSKTQCPKFEQ